MAVGPEIDDQIFNLAISYGRKKLDELASYAEWWCRRREATGILGDDYQGRHLWDEFCYDQHHGPVPELEDVWLFDMRNVVRERWKHLNEQERSFAMLAARFEYGDVTHDLIDPFVFDQELFDQAIYSAIKSRALVQEVPIL